MNTITNNTYEKHVEIVKNLKMSDDFYEVREPYKDAFEEIHEKASDENVTMNNAKEFLNSLSKDELSTLQNYTRLVNEIDVESLSDEGAYNLLLHHYEKYDFDNDGFVQNGEGKMGELIPKNIPAKEKQALVDTLNQTEKPLLAMALMFPPKINIPGVIEQSTTDTNSYDFESIMNRIDRVLNPLAGEHRSDEVIDIFKSFKEVFTKNYNELDKQINQSTSNNAAAITKARINSSI